MLESLQGKIKDKIDQQLLLALGPVVLRIKVPLPFFFNARQGEEILLFTHLYWRENEISLYGFPTAAEAQFFRLLINISGIGPKSALALLSQNTVEEIKKALAQGDLHLFTRTPGIGQKTARRLLLELSSLFPSTAEAKSEALSTAEAQLRQALRSLGYREQEIKHILPHLNLEQPLAKVLKKALQLLAPS